ncbi:hypothetical protein D082_08500 [Synechocystis sp. PCC 6714]|nr:hypothetical protein D082_08500 [Synechocystis sp. PCC 6714]
MCPQWPGANDRLKLNQAKKKGGLNLHLVCVPEGFSGGFVVGAMGL